MAQEYKFAPRPELVGNAETGYSFKAGTVKEGSTGELAGYFTTKGEKIQTDYKQEKCKAGQTKACQALDGSKKAAGSSGPAKSDDEIKIEKKLAETGCLTYSPTGACIKADKTEVGSIEIDDETAEILKALKSKAKKY